MRHSSEFLSRQARLVIAIPAAGSNSQLTQPLSE